MKWSIFIIVIYFRAAQQEIAALSHIAEQLNSKLSEPSGDSVDLDNLFAFLSDVKTSRNHIIDEIGEKMDELVTDLDVEVKYLYIAILFIELSLFNKI